MTADAVDYQPPELLPPNQAALEAKMPVNGRAHRWFSSEMPRRRMAALIAPPSVPSLLSSQTSALIVASDALFISATRQTLEAMRVRVLAVQTVGEALAALEEDISRNGCITYDQIICEVTLGQEGGGETLINELRATSWPASVVLVTPDHPQDDVLHRYARSGARAVVRKPVHQLELGRLFTHLKRLPHETLWLQGRENIPCRHGLAGEADCRRCAVSAASSPCVKSAGQPTPLHITAMGVGMVVFLHVHAGKEAPFQKQMSAVRRALPSPSPMPVPLSVGRADARASRPTGCHGLRVRVSSGCGLGDARVDLQVPHHRYDQSAARRGTPRPHRGAHGARVPHEQSRSH